MYYRDNSYIELNSEHTEAIKEAYEQFKLDIKLALLIGADLAPYIEAQLIDESLLFLKQSHAFTYLETAFKEALVENPNKGLNDFFNFSKLYGEHQTENKWDFNGFIKSQLTIQPELITTAAWHEQAKDVISQDVQEYAKLLSDNTLVEKTNELSIDDLILSLGHDSNAVESPMDFEAYSDETTYIDYQNIPYYLEDLKTQEVLI